MEEVEGETLLFLFFQGTHHAVVVAVEPLVAQLQCLLGIHLHEVGNVAIDQSLHLLDCDSVRYSLLFEETELALALSRCCLITAIVFVVIRDRLASLQTVLYLVEPGKDVSLYRLNLEKHREALLEIAL